MLPAAAPFSTTRAMSTRFLDVLVVVVGQVGTDQTGAIRTMTRFALGLEDGGPDGQPVVLAHVLDQRRLVDLQFADLGEPQSQVLGDGAAVRVRDSPALEPR